MADRYGLEAELAGDIVETTRKKQNSFDQTNSQQYLRPQQAPQPTAAPVAAGPVGRATQQLPVAPTSSLMDANMPRSAALGGQTSFDSSNTPSRYMGSPQAAPEAPQGLQRQGQSDPFTGVAKASNYTGSLDQFPVSGQGRLIASGTGRAQEPAGAPGDNQFRSTGYGAGAQGGAIAARVGLDGVPEFSNDAAAQRQAASFGSIPSTGPRQPASLNDIPVTRRQSQTEGQTLASLGDVGNLNNGVGTFSQAQPGDAALAMGRWQRAAEIRQDTKNQQRLDRALAEKYQDDHTVVVRDSTRPLTRDDLKRDELDQKQKQAGLDNIGIAQGVIAGTQAQRAGDQQLRQAARLEDIQVRAFAPGATQDDRNAFLQAKDPVGYLKNQQDSVTAALNNEKTQLQIDSMRSDQQQKASDRITAKDNAAATFDLAIGSIDTLGGVPGDPDRPEHPGLKETFGTFNSLTPTRPGSDSADFQARLDTLKAQTFLPQVAALKGTGNLSDAEGKKLSDSIGALSVKMSAEEFRKSLKEVRQTLVAARERSTKGSVGQRNSPQRTSAGPKPGDTEEGYEFIGGSPASPANWRKI